MTSQHPVSTDEESAFAQALDWLIALHDAPEDAALRASHQLWLDASPLHASAYREAQSLWGVTAAAPVQHAAQWQQAVVTPTSITPRRVRRRHRWARAASLALAACLLVAVLPGIWFQLQADYTGVLGGVRTVELSDGSRLLLEGDSAVSVEYSDTSRRVRLLSGRAFFEVRSDPRRPFTVMAGEVSTTNIGTAFEVERSKRQVDVAVESGRVRVESKGQRPQELGRGQQISIDPRLQGASARAIDPQLVAAWRQRQLTLEDQSVADAVVRLERYVPGSILVIDRQLARQRVTGSYLLDDPIMALEAVVQPHGGRVSRFGPYLTLVTRAR